MQLKSKHIIILTIVTIICYYAYLAINMKNDNGASTDFNNPEIESSIPPPARSEEDYPANIPSFYKDEDKELTKANEQKFDTVLKDVEFPLLEKHEEYRFKGCLSQYIPRYPDYSFKAENKPNTNSIATYIPLKTIQPSKNHILEKSEYYGPLEMRVGISQDPHKPDRISFDFEILNLYKYKYSRYRGRSRHTRRIEEKHSLSITKNLKNNQWSGFGMRMPNRLNSKYETIDDSNEREAIGLIYFYSMNIMDSFAGNIARCLLYTSDAADE